MFESIQKRYKGIVKPETTEPQVQEFLSGIDWLKLEHEKAKLNKNNIEIHNALDSLKSFKEVYGAHLFKEVITNKEISFLRKYLKGKVNGVIPDTTK